MLKLLLPLLTALSLLTAGCQFFGAGKQDDSQDSNTATTTEKQATTQQATGPLPPQQTYDLQQNTEQGIVLRLSKITFTEDSIIVDLAVTNGTKQVIRLNGYDDMFVSDDLGNTYRLVEPPDNPRISIDPRATLQGQFVFIGRLAPRTRFLNLTTNDRSDFRYRIPHPEIKFVNIPIKR